MRLDICIPAHNEAPVIAASVHAVREAFADIPHINARIMVADNASTDGTGDIVRALSLPDVSVIDVPRKGKGAAVIAAAHATDADLFGFVDADLSADPSHIRHLLEAMNEVDVHIAIGSRLHPEAVVDRGFARTVSSRAFNLVRKIIVGGNVRDSQCGIKITGKEGLSHLRACAETGWFFEVEWLCRAERAGLTIEEIPIVWQEFRYEDRPSKLKLVTDGLAALAAFQRIRERLR